MAEYLSIKELSEYLGVKPKTLYSWVKNGKIPAYKINGLLRFKFIEINAFVQSKKIYPKNIEKEAKIIIGNIMGFSNNSPHSGQVVSRKRRNHV